MQIERTFQSHVTVLNFFYVQNLQYSLASIFHVLLNTASSFANFYLYAGIDVLCKH